MYMNFMIKLVTNINSEFEQTNTFVVLTVHLIELMIAS